MRLSAALKVKLTQVLLAAPSTSVVVIRIDEHRTP
ncbi:Uncharacterised protein [Mycobacteroides abscessus subsp. abscessus]|nr:Uncharacterised protein [Mycobacteroides abscessus subsp. abscessus]